MIFSSAACAFTFSSHTRCASRSASSRAFRSAASRAVFWFAALICSSSDDRTSMNVLIASAGKLSGSGSNVGSSRTSFSKISFASSFLPLREERRAEVHPRLGDERALLQAGLRDRGARAGAPPRRCQLPREERGASLLELGAPSARCAPPTPASAAASAAEREPAHLNHAAPILPHLTRAVSALKETVTRLPATRAGRSACSAGRCDRRRGRRRVPAVHRDLDFAARRHGDVRELGRCRRSGSDRPRRRASPARS